MLSKKLQNHISLSHTAAQANKAKGNRYTEILSSLYSDHSRFIEELLQNASDACIRKGYHQGEGKVRFELDHERLAVYHNGIPFDEDDLIAITTIGKTTKNGYSDVNLIGKFGLGFKSVFAVCENPEIHSGNYHFRITDFEVLEETLPAETQGFGTCILLPLKKEPCIYETVLKGLEKISYHHLLFVRGYSSVEVATEKKTFSVQLRQQAKYNERLQLFCTENSIDPEPLCFIVVTSEDGNLTAAFRIEITEESGNACFMPLPGQTAHVFFPTNVETTLDFLIHGNFTTTPTREQIPFDSLKTPENIALLDRLTEMFSKLPLLLKKVSLLNASFWTQMPVFRNTNGNMIFNAVQSGLFKSLECDAVIPDSSGKFYRPGQLALVPDNIAALLSASDIRVLFDRAGMVHHEFSIKIFSSPDNLQVFKSLKQVDVSDFTYAIAHRPEFFKKKSLEWHRKFLRFLSIHPELWNRSRQESWFSLREKPFLLLNDLNVAAPFAGEKVQVFLYDNKRRGLPMVHRELMNDNDILSFFRMLEIPHPDEIQRFGREILPVFSMKSQTLRKNLNNWKKFMPLYHEANEQSRMQMLGKLAETECMPVKYSHSGQTGFCRPDETYVDNEDIRTFFGTIDIPVIHKAFSEIFEGNSSMLFQQISGLLGLNTLPRFVRVQEASALPGIDSFREKITQSGLTILKETYCDYDIHGLEDFFVNPTVEKSVILALIVTSVYPQAEIIFETYTRKIIENSEPAFIRKLKSRAWLFDKNGNLKTSGEQFALHPLYAQKGVNSEKLRNLFALQIHDEQLSDEEWLIVSEFRKKRMHPGDFLNVLHAVQDQVPEANVALNEIEPLVIQTDNVTENLEQEKLFTGLEQNVSFQNLLQAHSLMTGNNTAWFHDDIRQKRAVEIVEMLLKKELNDNYILEKLPESSVFSFDIKTNETIIKKVLVSGIKSKEGLFVFRFTPTDKKHDSVPCLIYAVDDVFLKRPVIYKKEIENLTVSYFQFGLLNM